MSRYLLKNGVYMVPAPPKGSSIGPYALFIQDFLEGVTGESITQLSKVLRDKWKKEPELKKTYNKRASILSAEMKKQKN